MRGRLTATLVALIAIMLGGSAYAAVQGSDNVIHGCYSTETHKGAHALLVLESGATCPGKTIALNWNQQGPAGRNGPAGPPGPAGQPGAPGTINGGAYSDSSDQSIAPGDVRTFGPALLTIADTSPAPPGQVQCHVVELLSSVELKGNATQPSRFVAQFSMDGQSTGIGPIFGEEANRATLTRSWSLVVCPGQHSFRFVVQNVAGGVGVVSFPTLTAIDLGRGPTCPGSQGCP